MEENRRFSDNNDGTVTDSRTGLTWAREDTWQKEGRWVTWDEAKEYAQTFCTNRFAGRGDWRLPTLREAQSLYDDTQRNKDKYGNEIHLDPVFPEGPQATIWCDEGSSGNEGYTLDLRAGEVGVLYKSKCPRMAGRAVSGEWSSASRNGR